MYLLGIDNTGCVETPLGHNASPLVVFLLDFHDLNRKTKLIFHLKEGERWVHSNAHLLCDHKAIIVCLFFHSIVLQNEHSRIT